MESIVQRDSLDEYTQKVSAKYKNMFAPKSAVGAPLSASTAAEMTDTTKIYVYTGSESGYTAGNWYYYDGSTWISGGVYNSTAFESDTTLSISGAAADAKETGDELATLRDNALTYIGKFLNDSEWATYFDSSFDGLPTNIFASCNVDNTNGTVIPDAPVQGWLTGTIITLGRESKTRRANYDTQIYIPQNRSKIWVRKYYNEEWTAWSAVGGTYLENSINTIDALLATVPQYRDDVNSTYIEKQSLVSNITEDGTFFITPVFYGGGAIARYWDDMPTDTQYFIVTNSRYSTNWILQSAIPTNSLGTLYRRLIPRPGSGESPREWVKVEDFDTRTKVLAIGDSICRGARNSEKGFVGDLGLPDYKNAGVSGASLSTISTVQNNVENIPARMIRFYNEHSKAVSAQNDGWIPDIIIANGGHNDYGYNAEMGTIPTEPAANINSLDESTVIGGLQKLFLLMIGKYPHAQRFFVTTHKIYRNAQVDPEKNGYLPTKQNGQGYTEAELHDAIVACCKVYNVKVIDIFNDSLINSFFAGYKGDTYYANNYSGASADMINYFDKDGVHPLSRGYTQGYIPLIREAIKIGTVKTALENQN